MGNFATSLWAPQVQEAALAPGPKPSLQLGTSVKALGQMQESFVINAEAVLVLEITTLGNLSSHCSFSAMNVLANGFGRSRCPVSQIKKHTAEIPNPGLRNPRD